MQNNPFYQKLIEKQQQKAQLLYSHANKENQQQQPKIKPQKQKKTKLEHSNIISHQPQTQWYLDTREVSSQQQSRSKMVNNWMCLQKGMVQFAKVKYLSMQLISKEQFPAEIEKILEESLQKGEPLTKSIVIEIWTAQTSPSLVDIFIEYALSLLSLGKGSWSLAAFTSHQCYDLLSLDCQGTSAWKEGPPLSKAQLLKQQLMRRVFGFAGEKEKDLGSHELMARWQLTSDTIVYFITRDISLGKSQSYALLSIEKENFKENRATAINLSILRPTLELIESEEKFVEVLKTLGLRVRRQDELSRPERQAFLKRLIAQLEGQLVGKQLELDMYKSEESPYVEEEELGIPSERLMMGEEHYQHLKRKITAHKIL